MSNENNGWTNRETWTVNNWLHQYIEVSTLVRDHVHNENAVEHLADFLKDFFSEICFPPLEGIYKDLLTLTLVRVNWAELAKVYIDNELSELDREKYAEYDAKSVD